jgi:hypothetical protein
LYFDSGCQVSSLQQQRYLSAESRRYPQVPAPCISKTVVFATQRNPASLGQTEALQIKATWRADLGGYSVKERCHSLH